MCEIIFNDYAIPFHTTFVIVEKLSNSVKTMCDVLRLLLPWSNKNISIELTMTWRQTSELGSHTS